MAEITPQGGIQRQTISPDTTAPSAPTITAPGAPSVSSPTTPDSLRRERELRDRFEDIEEKYRRNKYVGSKARRGDYRIKPGPATPVSDAYTTVIRPKDRQRVAREMLDDLVVQEEQRKRDDWLREEEVRAEVLPYQIRAEVQQAAWHDSINQYYNEQNKLRAEQAARDAEAQKYGYATDAELQQAIREEKAIKRANELGLALKEAELITQTIAREGYLGATSTYGRDPTALIAEQEAKAKAAQSSLEQNFGITMDKGNKPTDYFQTATDYAHQVMAAEAREEKAIRRANELGLALTETQLIGQAIAREGYTGATAKYGRDPQEMIAEQKARAAAAQTSLQQNFNILPDPRHQDYFSELSDFAARQRGVVSLKDSLTDQTGFRIGRAEMSLKTSDYPPPPSSTPLYDAAVKTGLVTAPVVGGTEKIQAAGSEWIEGRRASTHRVIDQMFPEGGIPKAVAGGMAEIGTGGWRALLGIQSMGLAVPAAEYAARHPQEFFAALAPGTAKYATDLVTHATQHPLQFGGELAAGALVFHGGAKVTGRVTAPLSSRITEFGIKIRTPAAHRPAVGAVSDIGRNVPGLRSTIEVDPDLSRILNIGKAAPQVEEVLAAQPHTIYGSATQIGQMPAKRIPATPKDLDVFVADPKAFNAEMVARLGPEYSVEGSIIRRRIGTGESPHAIDTHQFPEGYPVEGSPTGKIAKVAYQEEKIAPNLPFDFMPKEVLKAGKLTQEYLYTQTLRKASSVMGEPESLFRWKFGPPEHRMKDIPTLIADAEWLVESTKQRVPQMGLIERITAGHKVRKLEGALDVLRGDPLVQEALSAAPAATVVDDLPTITVISRAPRSRQSPNILAVPAASASPVVARKGSETVDAYVDQLTGRSPAVSRSPSVRASPSIFALPSPGRPSPAPSRPSPIFTITPSTVPSPPPTPRGDWFTPSGYRDPSPSPAPAPSRTPTPSPSSPPGITTPTIPSPTLITDITFTPPPPPRIRRVSSEKGDRRAVEDYIHYADIAFPVAQLESAYTNLPDPKIRPLKIAQNLFRVTRGPIELLPQRRPVRVATRRVRKPNRKRVPWETPWTIGDLDLF